MDLHPDEHTIAALRGELTAIVVGTVFLFTGLVSCLLAAIRHRHDARILVSFGAFSAMYGARLLTESSAFFALPVMVWPTRGLFFWTATYLIPIPAIALWFDLSRESLRPLLKILLAASALTGIAGIICLFVGPGPYFLEWLNSLVVICFLLILAPINTIPSLAHRYLIFPSPVVTTGTVVLAVAALYNNLQTFLRLPVYRQFEPLALGIFILSLGYAAAQKVFSDEQHLLTIRSELAIAREIQNSILPADTPKLENLRVSVAYHPMTEVAGDFYEFISTDAHRAGFLVADVSGHGVPAALVAAMIKMATQSAKSKADRPQDLLRELNTLLCDQLHGHFVSAAYLWFDTEAHKALYSAAGHPPLLRWRKGQLERIESNGLLFGVLPEPDYPVQELDLERGDRFLLYTDGITEPENAAGNPFGDRQLEQVIRDHENRPGDELPTRLMAALRLWHAHSATQQDDITLLVIDVA